MKTAECEGIEPAGALLAGAVSRAWNRSNRSPPAHNVKGLVDLGRSAARRWSAARPIAGPA
jgi:hypothetical protein